MASPGIFEGNLAALRKRCPWLIEELEGASTEGIEEVEGPRGARVLSQGGVLLGSAYDPEREAERLAQQMAKEPADILVAVGFGLGLQFRHYCERKTSTLIIYEPSAARLRAALELISIVPLLKKFPEIFIATRLEDLSQLVESRYVAGLCIRAIPHAVLLRLDEDSVKRAVERVRRVKEAADTRCAASVEKMLPWSKMVADNGRRIASCPSFSALEGAFDGQTAVVVAAGPSLDKQLALLAEYRDEVVVIAIGQVAKTLSAARVRPHLVHVLESRNVSHQLTDGGCPEELSVVLFPDCHPAIFDVPTRSTFVATPAIGPMGSWIARARGDERLVIGGGTVAQGAVGLADFLGVRRILLIGQDLAFTEGRAYAKDSAYDFVGYEVDEEGGFAWTNQKAKVALLGDRKQSEVRDRSANGEVVWVEGWGGGERVPTWRAYAAFIEQYRDIAAYLSTRGVELINCTEGGAHIPGLRHETFKQALGEIQGRSIDGDLVIKEAAANASRCEFVDFEAPLRDARRALGRLEKDVDRGLQIARRFKQKQKGAVSNDQWVGVLRALARQEKKLRSGLQRMPWMDSLVQPEIYAALATTRRSDRHDPSPEEVLDESRFLFEATRRGIGRGRSWFDDFEASFTGTSENRPRQEPLGAAERSGFAPV